MPVRLSLRVPIIMTARRRGMALGAGGFIAGPFERAGMSRLPNGGKAQAGPV